MTKTEKKALDFEAVVKRLDEITAEMEKEGIALEDALKLYEEGVALVRLANERLEDAERRVKMLKMTAEGEIVEEDFPTGQPEEGENRP